MAGISWIAGKGMALLLLLVLMVSPASVRADQLEYTSYWFSDNGDNSVYTSAFSLAKSIYARTLLMLDIELDQLTIPPLDGETGASRPRRRQSEEFRKNRGQIILGVEQGFGPLTRISANWYASQEVDYRSQSAVFSLTRELFDRNTTVDFRGQYTFDRVGEIRTDGSLELFPRETHQASLSIAQLLSPTTVFKIGFDGSQLEGLLSDPYRLVALPAPAGQSDKPAPVRERHPDSRYRGAAWAEINQFAVPLEASVVGSYRHYRDDWGVQSHTIQMRINKYLTRQWILSPDYRYYTQGAADFMRDVYDGSEPYVSGDYKLRAFSSNNMGLGLTWFPRLLAEKGEAWEFLEGASLSVLYFRYFNSLHYSGDVWEGKMRFDY